MASPSSPPTESWRSVMMVMNLSDSLNYIAIEQFRPEFWLMGSEGILFEEFSLHYNKDNHGGTKLLFLTTCCWVVV